MVTSATDLASKAPAPKVPKDNEDDVTMKDRLSSPKELRNALYAQCASQEEGRVFSQDDLLSYGIIPNNDIHKLLPLTHQLALDGLFKVMQKPGDSKTYWRVIKRDDAAKYKDFTVDEAIVYSYIESAGREGMWSKLLRVRTRLHQVTMNRALKSLENRGYIKPIKTVRFPTRKTYILAKLQPSDDVTGGPFYTDGVLDQEFIHQLSAWVERYVIGRSWWHPPPPLDRHRDGRRISLSKLTPQEIKNLRADYFQRHGPGRERSRNMLPMPPDYKGYPTLPEITKAINASKLTEVVMKVTEIQQLVDILCWDGRLERMAGGITYRAVRVVNQEGNGLTEAPCGRCPVFELCDEGGPVNARSCVYFEEWMDF